MGKPSNTGSTPTMDKTVEQLDLLGDTPGMETSLVEMLKSLVKLRRSNWATPLLAVWLEEEVISYQGWALTIWTLPFMLLTERSVALYQPQHLKLRPRL